MLLTQPSHWTFGVPINNVWSFAGSEHLAHQLALEFYGNAVYPTGTSSWTFRSQIAFLFPKLSPEEKKMLMEEQLKKLEQQQKAPENK